MRYMIGALLMVMLATAAWSHPVYGPNGEIVGETLEWPWHEFDGIILGEIHNYKAPSWDEDIIGILEECLEYIPDGSDIEHEPTSPITLTYSTTIGAMPLYYIEPKPWTEPGPITKAEMEVARLKRQTELNHKIKAMIKTLKGEN